MIWICQICFLLWGRLQPNRLIKFQKKFPEVLCSSQDEFARNGWYWETLLLVQIRYWNCSTRPSFFISSNNFSMSITLQISAVDASKTALKAGFLKKLGYVNPEWQQRYIVVTEHKIYWFNESNVCVDLFWYDSHSVESSAKWRTGQKRHLTSTKKCI